MSTEHTNCKQKLDDKDETWNKKKTENVAATKALEQAEPDNPAYDTLLKWSQKMSQCSMWLLFSEYQNLSTAELKRKLKNASFCRVRGCLLCDWRKSMANFGKAMKTLPQISEKYPTYEFLFLTLGAQNCSVYDLREELQYMGKAWRRLTQRKEFKVIKGFIRTTEVTRNSKTGSANPHFHAILAVPSSYFKKPELYIKHERWVELWRKALKVDYDPNAHIKRIKKSNIDGGLKEVIKYTAKGGLPTEDPAFFREMLVQIQRLHLVATNGIFKGIFSEDVTEKEMLVTETEEETEEAEGPNRITDENGDVWEEIEEILFRWKGGEYSA